MYLPIPGGDWLAIPLVIACGSAAAALNTGSRLGRAASVVLLVLAFLVPFIIAPSHPILRFSACLGSVLGFFRNLDLWTGAHDWDAARRVLHVIAFFDSRRATHGPAAFDTRAWLRVLVLAPLMALGLLVAFRFGPEQPPAGPGVDWALHWTVRWLGGALYAYTSFEMATCTVRGLARGVGITPPPLQDDPIRARTVAEFWGKRWNLTVHGMLFEHCFRPLARRRRPALGALAAFAVSALFHFWITFVPLGLFWAAVMAAFFLVQAALLLAERALAVARWRPALQHAFTIVCVLGTSPLVVEPLLRIMLP